jgi:hypothetical protein
MGDIFDIRGGKLKVALVPSAPLDPAQEAERKGALPQGIIPVTDTEHREMETMRGKAMLTVALNLIRRNAGDSDAITHLRDTLLTIAPESLNCTGHSEDFLSKALETVAANFVESADPNLAYSPTTVARMLRKAAADMRAAGSATP